MSIYETIFIRLKGRLHTIWRRPLCMRYVVLYGRAGLCLVFPRLISDPAAFAVEGIRLGSDVVIADFLSGIYLYAPPFSVHERISVHDDYFCPGLYICLFLHVVIVYLMITFFPLRIYTPFEGLLTRMPLRL